MDIKEDLTKMDATLNEIQAIAKKAGLGIVAFVSTKQNNCLLLDGMNDDLAYEFLESIIDEKDFGRCFRRFVVKKLCGEIPVVLSVKTNTPKDRCNP